jgi:large subunit ribosomal protein L29
MATAAELRGYDDDELATKLIEGRKELFNLRFQSATGRLDNSARIGQVRKEIARVLTVQRAKEIELAEAEFASAGADNATKEK